MRNVKWFLVLLLHCFNSFGQKEFTSLEFKLNPSKSFQYLRNASKSIEDTAFKKASAYELGVLIKHNYNPRFSVSTGIVGMKQKIKIEKEVLNNLREVIGEYDENQIYDYFIIPLVFSYNVKSSSKLSSYFSITTDHQFIIRYIEKYKDLPEENIHEIKDRVYNSFNEIKDAKTTLFNLELGVSIGGTYKVSKKAYVLCEPNYLISLKELKEINDDGKLYLNKIGCRIGLGYKIL